ncbi:hypothetical protein D3C78_832500 [compost metagenome]
MRTPDAGLHFYLHADLTAVQQRLDNVFFHHVAGNAEPGGDLAIGMAMQAAEHEDLLAASRQGLDGPCHQNQVLPSGDDPFLPRLFAGNGKTRFVRGE